MTAEEIVRTLAAVDNPTVVDPDYGYATCGLCDGNDDRKKGVEHNPECPWRLAREWVASVDAKGKDAG